MIEIIYLMFIAILAAFLGYELIRKVPSTLHTPLMSATNAISGVTLIGALALSGSGQSVYVTILGTVATILATVNVVGGYFVTSRMLKMFHKKK